MNCNWYVSKRISFLILFGLVACQTRPTKVTESLTLGPDSTSRLISEKTVVLDVRDYFTFLSGHLSQAVHLRWDFIGQKGRPGTIRDDFTSLAREFARLGVGYDSHVLVVGLGKEGNGEEGRVAWALKFLGIENVTFVSDRFFVLKRKTGEATPINATYWIPKLKPDLKVTAAEIKKLLLADKGAYIIDVRSPEEYLKGPSMNSIKNSQKRELNIPWREFIDENGFPNMATKAQLEKLGIRRESLLVVVSRVGVESALVTLVLREMGFGRAANLEGGMGVLTPVRGSKN